MQIIKWFGQYAALIMVMTLVIVGGRVDAEEMTGDDSPIVLRTMGSLFFGGSIGQTKDGVTFHGDHGYAQYYIPQDARQYPLVMWHGIGQSGKTYESTPDGREGFQAILTRRNWPVYIIDQPRRGRAGRTQAKPRTVFPPVLVDENGAWNAFRVGLWIPPESPSFYREIQFPRDGYSIDQFMRQQTPDTGDEPWSPEHRAFLADAMAKLFQATGPGVLITHSMSGIYGWGSAIAAPNHIKAVVAYEPGSVIFPEGETPADIPVLEPAMAARFAPVFISKEDFQKLTKIPLLLIYGDFIPSEPFMEHDTDFWRGASIRARQFVETVNRHGGDAKLVMLPEIGIKGNSHFPFADLNNIEIADHLEAFLQEKGLNGSDEPHRGPRKNEMPLTVPVNR